MPRKSINNLFLSLLLLAAVCPAWEPPFEFQGNRAYDARRLSREMRLDSGGQGTTDSLPAALERLAAFYRRNGFIQSRVEFLRGNAGAGTSSVRILVDEGPRFTVKSVSFRGNDSLPEERLMKAVGNRPGRPFNPDGLGGDEFKVLMAYADSGYVFAGVENNVELLPDTTVAVTFSIFEGRRVRVGEVGVTGNGFTAREAVARRIKVSPGKYFSRRALLQGELALAQTGLFREARVQPGAVSQDSQTIDVEIRVVEKPRRRFETGLGYGSGDAFRVMARWLNRNVGGWGERLDVSGLLAVQLWRDVRLVRGRSQVSYQEPWLFGRDLPGGVSLYYDDYRPPYTDYRLQTVGFDLELYQKLAPDAAINWRASQQWLKLSPNWRDPESPSDTIKYHGRRTVFSGWSLNRLDDPLTPSKGFATLADLEYTGGIFGGMSTFQRINATLIGYFTLPKPKTTMACRLRGGVIGDWQKRHVVPYYERYYLGGPTTLRGYSNGKAGLISESGTPLGGKKMILANVELRPVIYRRWLASVYLDVGILSDSPLRKMSLSEAYTSPGFGLRYVLPLGTGRLDLAAPGTQTGHINEWKIIVAWGEIF